MKADQERRAGVPIRHDPTLTCALSLITAVLASLALLTVLVGLSAWDAWDLPARRRPL